MDSPPLTFVLAFLFFSFLFLSNSYKLWFKTDSYHQDVLNSLLKTPVPFKEYFIKRLENKKRWEVEQKIFSAIGFVVVIFADILLVAAYFQ